MSSITNTPTLMIIFGGTGDLARRKLLPALLDLHVKGMLPDVFRIVAFSRRTITDEEYRSFVKDTFDAKGHNHSEESIQSFLQRVFYQQGMFDESESYIRLAKRLEDIDANIGTCTNKLMYLAVPPKLYESIFNNFKVSKLNEPCSDQTGWTRVLVEKPFGSDLASAQHLEDVLASVFKEEQIFRIDHYLTKEALQNILTFRFSNVVFESSWNNQFIEYVHIHFVENFGVEQRGAFYDKVGALRDVGQNHMLQMLALVAMDNPGHMKSSELRKARNKVLESLKIYTKKDLPNVTRRGQYLGYRDIEGVEDDSDTETYFFVKAFVENDRWRGVPFLLEGGKNLDKRESSITIRFKSPDQCVCGAYSLHDYRNTLKITVEPDQKISVRFWGKKPGLTFGMESRDLIFDHKSHVDETSAEAYEKVVYDCIQGDQTLFVSTDEVKSAWKFITPILEGWGDTDIHTYEPLSAGPPKIEIPLFE